LNYIGTSPLGSGISHIRGDFTGTFAGGMDVRKKNGEMNLKIILQLSSRRICILP